MLEGLSCEMVGERSAYIWDHGGAAILGDDKDYGVWMSHTLEKHTVEHKITGEEKSKELRLLGNA